MFSVQVSLGIVLSWVLLVGGCLPKTFDSALKVINNWGEWRNLIWVWILGGRPKVVMLGHTLVPEYRAMDKEKYYVN